MWRTLIVSLALICLVLLGWYANTKFPGKIEAGLAARAQAAVKAEVPEVVVQASQRDVVLSGRVPDEARRARAEALAGAVSGVRSVINQIEVGASAQAGAVEPAGREPESAGQKAPVAPPEVAKPAEKPAADAAPAERAAEAEAGEGAEVEAGEAAEVEAGEGAEDKAAEGEAGEAADGEAGEAAEDKAADGEAGEAADGEAGEAAEDKAADGEAGEAADGEAGEAPAEAPVAPADGPLTAAQCKSLIDETLAGERRIAFHPNTGKVTDEDMAQLRKVWGILQRCPDARGVIEAYHDGTTNAGAAQHLTQVRAYNTHRRLTELGMPERRFRYVGRGNRNLRYQQPEQRHLNQRIEFNITVE